MLTGASEAESAGNLIKQVWYNAIYEEKDDDTDNYTRPEGSFVSDFNEALGNLFADSSFSSQMNTRTHTMPYQICMIRIYHLPTVQQIRQAVCRHIQVPSVMLIRIH